MAQQPVPVALFSGPSDPAVMRSYLNSVINQLNNLIEIILQPGIINTGLLYPTRVANTALYNAKATDQMIEFDASGAGGAGVVQFDPVALQFQSFGVIKIDSSVNMVQIKQLSVSQALATLIAKNDSIIVWSDGTNMFVF